MVEPYIEASKESKTKTKTKTTVSKDLKIVGWRGPLTSLNSNTAFADDEFDTMQALSHFSYHYSGGSKVKVPPVGSKTC